VNQGGYVYAAYHSQRLYDLGNDAVSVEVTQAAAGNARTFLVAHYDDQNYLELGMRFGKLICASVVDGNLLILATPIYNPLIDRFWRIRDNGVTTFWETSPDGVAYVIRAQTPTAQLFPLSSVRINIGAALASMDPGPGEARFDTVNGGGPSAVKWCPPTALTDDFEDGVRGREWLRSYDSPNCTLTEVGGELAVKPPDNAVGYCAYGSSSSYDLTGSAMTMEVPSMVDTTTNAQVYFAVLAEEGYLEFLQESGTLLFQKHMNGTTKVVGTVAYSPAAHRWWRFREQSNTTYWEYSADGVMWKVGAMESPNPIPVTAIDIALGAGTYQAIPAPGEVHYDNFNLPP
jgi:hypothetical protein